jgi:hypothetical protein
VFFAGGGVEDYAAAVGLLRYDATVSSGVGLPHSSLPEPSAYAALLQVARAVMRDRYDQSHPKTHPKAPNYLYCLARRLKTHTLCLSHDTNL